MENDINILELMPFSIYTASSVVRKAVLANMEHKLLNTKCDLDMNYYRNKADVDITISLSKK